MLSNCLQMYVIKVFYHFDDSLLPQDQAVIRQAMQTIEDLSCVRCLSSFFLSCHSSVSFEVVSVCCIQGFVSNLPVQFSEPKRKKAFSQPQIYTILLFNCLIWALGM